MNDQFESKIIKSCVAKLRNSPAITCVVRLELDHFDLQLDSPSFNQRLPNPSTPILSRGENLK